MRILVIEDHEPIAGFVKQGLTQLGYTVDVVVDGDKGDAALAANSYDLVLLDVMLPGRSGVEVCAGIRSRGLSVPVLMLTALSSTGDKVSGLDAGADDYLTKPFEFDELAARVKALLRRGQSGEATTVKYADLTLDRMKRVVTRGEHQIRLTGREFALIEFLMKNADRTVTRSEIGKAVWEMDFDYGGNVIEVYVSTLRRKLDKGTRKPLIHTVVGVGYTMSVTPPPQP